MLVPPKRPLRAWFLSEGVLGFASLQAQLESLVSGRPDLRPSFDTLPPPSRLEAVMLRRFDRLGDLDLQPLRWGLRYSWRCRRLFRKRVADTDVVLVITQACALLARGPMRRVPWVISLDATGRQYAELEYWRPRGRFGWASAKPLEALERRAYAGAAAVIAWSDWTARSLMDDYGVPRERLFVLHPGLDLDFFSQIGASRRGPHSPLRLLLVGNGLDRKGFRELHAALDLVARPVELDVVTNDPPRTAPGVRFHSGIRRRSDALLQRFAEADVFVLPTRADVLPWVVLEAMAAGLPVVSTAVGAIPEMIGDAGVVVGDNDPATLAAAIRELADDASRREELSRRARERVRQLYDAAVQTPRLVELLRNVAAGDGVDA